MGWIKVVRYNPSSLQLGGITSACSFCIVDVRRKTNIQRH